MTNKTYPEIPLAKKPAMLRLMAVGRQPLRHRQADADGVFLSGVADDLERLIQEKKSLCDELAEVLAEIRALMPREWECYELPFCIVMLIQERDRYKADYHDLIQLRGQLEMDGQRIEALEAENAAVTAERNQYKWEDKERLDCPALASILEERRRQEQKWGEQNHTLGNWGLILTEEVGEWSEAALHTQFGGPKANGLRVEAVQVAAVALQIVQWMDRQATLDAAKGGVR